MKSKWLILIFLIPHSIFAATHNKIQEILTDHAPPPIGTYSQAMGVQHLVFISGQIGTLPGQDTLINDFTNQAQQAFNNLQAISRASGSNLDHIVKLTIYLTDLAYFPEVNRIMTSYFKKPYPSRATIQVSRLPHDAKIEVDAILYKD